MPGLLDKKHFTNS